MHGLCCSPNCVEFPHAARKFPHVAFVVARRCFEVLTGGIWRGSRRPMEMCILVGAELSAQVCP